MAKFIGAAGIGIITLSSVLAFSGCAGGSNEPTSPPATSDVASPTDSSSPSPSASATASGTPLTLGCTQLLSLQNVYDYNPNFSENPSFTVPPNITPLTEIGGVACGWVNLSSKETFSVGVAKPDAATETAAANAAASQLQPVPTYGTGGIEGFFGVQSNVGTAVVFSNGYWIVITSSLFFEPGDASQLMSYVLSNLP